MAAGDAFTCLLHRSGRVRCFGRNDAGQLGDGRTKDRPRPGAYALSNARLLAAGAEHACAVVDEGRVRCWGLDRYGQVGAGKGALYVTQPSLVDVVTDVSALALGAAHSCALASGGDVWCWGGDFAGQRGDGDEQARLKHRRGPSRVDGLARVTALTSGAHHSCALTKDAEVRCWGAAADGKLGSDVVEDQRAPVPLPTLAGAREIAAGGTFTCALVSDVVRCLGGGFGSGRDIPARGASRLVAGAGHACFVTPGGARCVGDASGGQLGDGERGGLASSRPLAVPGLSDAVRLAASGDRTCALRSNAAVSCWGAGRSAPEPLADGAYVDVVVAGGAVAARREGGSLVLLAQDALTTRAHIARSGALDLDEGRRHACAVVSAGEVTCWGAGGSGQLGDGARSDRTDPVRVRRLRGGASVGAGASHSCALTDDGAVWCWGSHLLGELGSARRTGSDVPVRVELSEAAVELDVGEHHACARLESGAVSCWGAGKRGELGDGDRRGSRWPVKVAGLDDAVALSVGRHHACASLVEGQVACWGENERGQLGDGTRGVRARPALVPGLGAVVDVVTGDRHTCARGEDGQVFCWGAGERGQLGQGAPLFSDTAVVVEVPPPEGERG